MMMKTYNIEIDDTIQVVEAHSCKFIDGALVFYDAMSSVKEAFPPGSWKRVWQV